MTPEELKNSILQLAIQGKLVEQRPEEGTGEELYQQIQAEKQRLIKTGTIKKDKPLPAITDDEKTFDIPEWWKWCRLGELGTLVRGITFPGTDKSREPLKGCIRCATTGSVQSSYNETADVFVPAKYIKNTMQWLENEDIMLSTANSKELVGKSCLWFGNDKMTFGGFLTVARFPDLLCRKYLYYSIQYLHKSGIFAKASTQTTNIANINNDILSKMLISLPPIAEQKRIVAKIEELLPHIDQYGRAWSKLEDFNKRFPTDMQKSILQIAIQGKLVEQLQEEGTGEELYEKIQAEKNKLVKAGKIKKNKPLPEIMEDEKPFDIPENWMWVRWGDIALFENGDRSNKYPVEADYVDFGIPFFGAKDMNGRYMSFADVRYISEKKFIELGNGKLQDNDFICLLRGSVGKNAIFKADDNHKTGFICAQMVIIRSLVKSMVDYIYFYMGSPYYSSNIEIKTSGTAVRQLPAKELEKMLVPLPPLAEQMRIVDKLQEILPLCERLK